MENNIDSENDTSVANNEADKIATAHPAGADQSKRALAKVALATPIITSLVSHPVWGAGVACSISGMQSGNASDAGQTPPPCEGSGCTPGFYKNNLAVWLIQTPYIPGICKSHKNTKNPNSVCLEWNYEGASTFLDAFGVPSETVNGDTASLLEVLNHADYDETGNTHSVEAHFVAALLNASAQPATYGASAQEIIDAVAGVYNGTLTMDDGTPITIDQLFQTLVRMNEAGGEEHCLFNAHGFCNGDKVSNGEECIVTCQSGFRYDYCEGACVEMKSKNPPERLDDKPFVSIDEALNTTDPQTLCKP